MAGLKKILFVCIGNACRSQMAEGFARRSGNGRIEVKSAGTNAMGYVDGDTIEAMKEACPPVDISRQTSKQLTQEMIEWADVVVTLGCQSAERICPPDYRGKKIDWPIKDPMGSRREFMEFVRDDIGKRVRELIDSALK